MPVPEKPLNIATAQNPAPSPKADDAPTTHGPFRPIQRTAGDEFTEVQRAHLAELSTQYVARTKASKDFTIQYREKLSDPRADPGLNRIEPVAE